MRRGLIVLLAALPALVASAVAGPALAASTTATGFGFLPASEGFSAEAVAEGGGPETVAGAHPYALRIGVGLRLGAEVEGKPGVPFSAGDLRDLHLEMPPGLLENPNVVGQCSAAAFHAPRVSPFEASASGESCPDDSQVGTVEVSAAAEGGATRRFGLFNLAPPPGVPSEIGFAPFGEPIVFAAEERPGPDGTYALTLNAVDVPQWINVHALRMTIWGTPWGVSHNGERGNCLNEAEPSFPWAKCSVGPPSTKPPLAYLTMPTTCEGPLWFGARADAWQGPGEVATVAISPQLGGCEGLTFDPLAFGRLTDKKGASPTGFNFQLTNDNSALTVPGSRIPSQTRALELTLPEGATINPSVAAGLGVCTPAQYGGEAPTSPPGSGCPSDSKIGDFSVETPLFAGQLQGAIYLAEPDDPGRPGAENPFDALVAVYLVARLPERGVLIRLAGELHPDPGSGQITARFDSLPELPYTNLQLNFREGQRAPLVTPPNCGTYLTQIQMSPWAGGARQVHLASESSVGSGIEGGPCPSGTPPFRPAVSAGGLNSNAGSYTPYFVHIKRQDTEQEVTSYSLDLPQGISGKLAGVPLCSDAAIAAARGRSGVEETEHPSCPAAGQVGRTLTGYGVGPSLTYAPGRVYLAGPYHGQPLSLVTINAATVGPFDLGTIVIRSAFSVNELTGRLAIDSSGSDPIPHILKGIPLRLRDIRIYIDRPEFTLNPTSCEPSQLDSKVTGSGANFGVAAGGTSTSSVHFQLLNCGTLGYSPKLGLKMRGGTKINQFPSLQAVVQGRPGDANLKDFVVTMPHSEFLAQQHIRGVCTRVQFAADACPANSIYGSAVAFTPLLDEPLRGNVYLRSSSHAVPDLVASLYSGSIHLVLDGRIGSKHGGIQTSFSDLPDEPLTRFVMRLRGGKHGLLVNSANICQNPPVATVRAVGQNNRGARFRTVLRAQRCRSHRHKKKHRRKRGHHHRGKGKHAKGKHAKGKHRNAKNAKGRGRR
jgi:hypothetical protein